MAIESPVAAGEIRVKALPSRTFADSALTPKRSAGTATTASALDPICACEGGLRTPTLSCTRSLGNLRGTHKHAAPQEPYDLAADAHNGGWTHYLARLRGASEGRPPGPDPFVDQRVPTPEELQR